MQYLDDFLPGLTNSNNLMVLRTQQVDMANATLALVTTAAGTGEAQVSAMVLEVDPNGGANNLKLPPEESSAGVFLLIRNSADAAETITVQTDAGVALSPALTIAQNKAALVACIPNNADPVVNVWRTLLKLA